MLVWVCQHFSGEINGLSLFFGGMAIQRRLQSKEIYIARTHTHISSKHIYTNEYMINECGRIELQVCNVIHQQLWWFRLKLTWLWLERTRSCEISLEMNITCTNVYIVHTYQTEKPLNNSFSTEFQNAKPTEPYEVRKILLLFFVRRHKWWAWVWVMYTAALPSVQLKYFNSTNQAIMMCACACHIRSLFKSHR